MPDMPGTSHGRYDERAEAEIAILTDTIAAVDAALTDAARHGRRPHCRRAHVIAVVLYELITSARNVAGPETGRLYAAPILDSLVEHAPTSSEISPLDLLIPLLVTRHTTTVR
ncbi:hypothetical protein ACRS6B_20340 [Nocardia asteroides]